MYTNQYVYTLYTNIWYLACFTLYVYVSCNIREILSLYIDVCACVFIYLPLIWKWFLWVCRLRFELIFVKYRMFPRQDCLHKGHMVLLIIALRWLSQIDLLSVKYGHGWISNNIHSNRQNYKENRTNKNMDDVHCEHVYQLLNRFSKFVVRYRYWIGVMWRATPTAVKTERGEHEYELAENRFKRLSVKVK